MLLAQVIQGLQCHLLRGDGIAGLLKIAGLNLREIRTYRRIQRIEIFAKPQSVKLVAPFLNCLRDRRSDASTFVAKKRQQTDSGAAKLRRNVHKGGDVERSKNGGQTDNENHAWPDNLPGTDFQVQSRHPITPDPEDKKTRGHEVARVHSTTKETADDREHDDRENSRRREHQPRGCRVVAEKRLEQGREGYSVGIESGKRAKDDDATDAKVPILERPEIDQGIIVACLAKNETAQAKHEQAGERLHAEKWIAEPIPFLAFTE